MSRTTQHLRVVQTRQATGVAAVRVATFMVLVLVGLSASEALASATTTLCTVTINSRNERDALRSAYPHARIVELTDYAAPGDPGAWLSAACKAGVRCDVLLVSGHFAGTFFGDSPFDLSLKALERQACRRTCDGLLSARAIFLFGCNTLAGKDLDRRTPARYRQVLLNDGLAPDVADRVAALRYGPLGRETRARMRRVFSADAFLFGFSSVGPIGSAGGPAFRRFLDATKEPLAALWNRPAQPATETLTREWRRAFRGAHPDVASGGTPLGPDECVVNDPDSTRVARLLGAERLLSADPLRYAFVVWDVLRTQAAWKPDEVAVLDRIAANRPARDALVAAMPRLTASLDSYFSMLRLARLVGWVDVREFERLQAARLSRMLRDGMTPEEHDFICDNALTAPPSSEALARNRGSALFIDALACLSARTPSVRAFLLSHLSHRTEPVRLVAIETLTALSLLEPRDTERLMRIFDGSRGELRSATLWALRAANGADLDVQRFIARAAGEVDEDVAWTSTQVIQQLRVTDAHAQASLASALARPDGFARRAAALALSALSPLDAGVRHQLRSHVDDPDTIVQNAVRSALTTLNRRAGESVQCDDTEAGGIK